jgi:two-component system chemotaxis sensor kinase CheA
MSDYRQEALEDTAVLRQMLDTVAAQLVLGDGSCADPWLDRVASSLAQVAAIAELIGKSEIYRASMALEKQVVQVRRGAGDREALEPALRSGVAHLQEALERASAGSREPMRAPATTSSNSLAQDPELVSDFIRESREHLTNIESQLLALEQSPDDLEPVHTIFRGFHTIKGLSGFLEVFSMQAVAHEVETLLDLARNARLKVTPAVIDGVLAGADYLSIELRRVEAELKGAATAAPADNLALLASIRALIMPVGESGGENGPPSPADDLRSMARAVARPDPAAQENETHPDAPEKKVEKKTAGTVPETRAVKVDTGKLDYLVDMMGEMVIAESMVRHNPALAGVSNPGLVRSLAQLGRITNEVQKTAMSMRMVPVGQLFQKMARLVRDLSRKNGKQVELETAGEDTELDRNIVEELADPLMHMVRNALDHGIETPEGRREAGKDPKARVTLGASHQAGHILIQVSDDGRGLNKDRIVAKAIEKKLIESAEHLSDTEIFNLIFEPGFSTAEQVTDISGRGVGMDVVRKKIQQLRGRVEIQSKPGCGTRFLMKLPLTLAIIEGLVVGVGRQRYIVPVFAVKEMLRPTEETMFTVENRKEMALVRERLFPVVRLYQRFQVVPGSEDYTKSVLIIAESEGKDFGLLVDEVIGKQEVVIKSLGESLKDIAGVAGGAILGDGRVGLILDMEGIFGRGAHV